MTGTEKASRRACPLFKLSPIAVDKTSNNCGSCKFYNAVHRMPDVKVCTKHDNLIQWMNKHNPV